MKVKRNEQWLLENGKYKCPHCAKEYTKMGICTHIWRAHGAGSTHDPNIGFKTGDRETWNKGLTAETNDIIKQKVINLTENNKKLKIEDNEEYLRRYSNPHSIESRNKISESMKLAHAEGRAWNIGMSRWNNEPSYPEQFFKKVIENEFENTDVIQEYNVGRYSIDFAWPELKKAIEIDGEQHYRFEEVIERDKRKNTVLSDNGWQLLRIRWTDMFHNTQTFIKQAKDFIDN